VKKVSFADMHCSVAQSLEVIGEWWTLLILRDAFLGVTRFDDFASRLGISRNVLTARLDTLVDNDVLARVPYDEARGRYDYRLTDKGRALLPVMTALRQWGDEWIVGEEHAPLVVEHAGCGRVSRAVLVCEHCGEELTTRNLRAIPGPGATEETLIPARSS
jgi:DNA-binding HxlR family transcriptional regulator